MALAFSPISSPGATRDLLIDLTGALEEAETIAAVTINSGHPAVLSVGGVAINSSTAQVDDLEVAAGKGVHLTIETLQRSQTTVPLVVLVQGNQGTSDTYEILQPVVPRLCE